MFSRAPGQNRAQDERKWQSLGGKKGMKEEAAEGRTCQRQEAAWKLNLKDLLLWLERENSPLHLPQEVLLSVGPLLGGVKHSISEQLFLGDSQMACWGLGVGQLPSSGTMLAYFYFVSGLHSLS